MGAPSGSCSAVLVRLGTGPLPLERLLVGVAATHMPLLRLLVVLQPWMEPRGQAVVRVALQVLGLEVSSTGLRISCAPSNNLLARDWHPTFLSQGY